MICRRSTTHTNVCGKEQAALGFTLIELLICITIIALLVALLIPALRQARSRSQAALCLSNLHGYGVILQQYIGDSNDLTPASSQLFTTYAGTLSASFSGGSSRARQAWYCPGSTGGGIYQYTTYYGNVVGMAYIYYTPGGKLSTFTAPSQLVFMADGAVYDQNHRYLYSGSAFSTNPSSGIPSYVVAGAPWATNSNMQPLFQGRHGGSGSVLWFDGHASLESPYLPQVDATVDPNQLIAKYAVGFLTPLNNMSYTDFKATPKMSKDAYFTVTR